MNNFINKKFAVLDMEWFHHPVPLLSLYEVSFLTYNDISDRYIVKPQCDIDASKCEFFNVDDDKLKEISSSKLNFTVCFHLIKKKLLKTDVEVIYTYGANDIFILKEYAVRSNSSINDIFFNNNGKYIKIIDFNNLLFGLSHGPSVANMHNLLLNKSCSHNFSSLDDCVQLKDSINYILDNNLDKESVVNLICWRILDEIYNTDNLILETQTLRGIYPVYSKLAKEKICDLNK